MLQAIPLFQREPIKDFLFSYHMQTCKEAISLKSFIANALKAWQQNKFGMREVFKSNDTIHEEYENSVNEALDSSKLKYNLTGVCDGHQGDKSTVNKSTYSRQLHFADKEDSKKSYLNPTQSFINRAIDKSRIQNLADQPATNTLVSTVTKEKEESSSAQRSPSSYAFRNFKSHFKLYKEPAQGDENKLLESNRCSSALENNADSPKDGSQTMISSYFNRSYHNRSIEPGVKGNKKEKYHQTKIAIGEKSDSPKFSATQAIFPQSKPGKTMVEIPNEAVTKDGHKIPFLRNLKLHSSMKNIKDEQQKGYSSKLKHSCWKSAKVLETKKPTEVQMVNIKPSYRKPIIMCKTNAVPVKSPNNINPTAICANIKEVQPISAHYIYKGFNFDHNLESIFNGMSYTQLANIKKSHLLYATHINQAKK
jgi:hypothetical protein